MPVSEKEWLPIKSAPKDGTLVLLFNEAWGDTHTEVQIAHWDGDREEPNWNFESELCLDDLDDEDARLYGPTHWMPIPPFPAGRAKLEGDRQ